MDEHTNIRDGTERAAARLLDGEPDMSVFSTWALGFLRGVQRRDLRHAALDGILAARWDDGLQVTTSAPVKWTPSGTAAGHTAGNQAIKFTLTVTNGSKEGLDPVLGGRRTRTALPRPQRQPDAHLRGLRPEMPN